MNKQIGNFTFIETSIKDVYIIEPKKYGDNRGYFMETYKESDFKAAGLDYNFIQDNQSKSKKWFLGGCIFKGPSPRPNWSVVYRVRYMAIYHLIGLTYSSTKIPQSILPAHIPHQKPPLICWLQPIIVPMAFPLPFLVVAITMGHINSPKSLSL